MLGSGQLPHHISKHILEQMVSACINFISRCHLHPLQLVADGSHMEHLDFGISLPLWRYLLSSPYYLLRILFP
jgi:hypothetical protein